jgi:hypothetical protein
VNQKNLALSLITVVLRIALVLALFAAGWSIYRHLPGNAPERATGEADVSVEETALRIILRATAGEPDAPLNVPVELYSIDIMAAQNEFFSERRPGKRLDDFLAERMGNRAPVEGRLDREGQTTVQVKPGAWWIHATLPGTLNIEWRLRVNVSGRKQTVELTSDNAYTRTKSF